MQDIATRKPNFSIRHATGADAALVVGYMRKLGEYQKMADAITATEDQIRRLLERTLGEAIFGMLDGEIVGFAYFFEKSSAFTGRSGLYIDGFLIDAQVRHMGLGKVMMGYLCQHALERGCEMMEWGCLDWNAPAIRFYRDLGAYSVDEMTIYRFRPDTLRAHAEQFAQESRDAIQD